MSLFLYWSHFAWSILIISIQTSSTGSTRNLRSFYLRFRLLAVQKLPFKKKLILQLKLYIGLFIRGFIICGLILEECIPRIMRETCKHASVMAPSLASPNIGNKDTELHANGTPLILKNWFRSFLSRSLVHAKLNFIIDQVRFLAL